MQGIGGKRMEVGIQNCIAVRITIRL
jgi:hypothetical protein